MEKFASPRDVVDRQIQAYNAHDTEEFCALYAPDAVLSKINGDQEKLVGIDAIRARYADRFSNPRLHCEIKSRIELGDFVLDHECVTGLGKEPLEAIAIYEVRESLIRSVRFIWS